MMRSSTSMKALNFLLLFALVRGNMNADSRWDTQCAVGCSCHLGTYKDLPFQQWIKQEEKEKLRPPLAINEAFYEDSLEQVETHKGEFLRQAICILHTNDDPQTLIRPLPENIQALTILQSRGSEDITLKATHFKHFQQLIYLDMRGYSSKSQPPIKENLSENRLIMSNNLLGTLTSLQYLSLQHISIQSKSFKKNETRNEGYYVREKNRKDNGSSKSFYIQDGRQLKRNREEFISSQFFIRSNLSQKVLPYKIEREQKQARLSIFAGLTNLVGLRVIACELHELYWEMFHGLNKIEFLSLEENDLLFLPEFTFYGTPHLKVLSLAHNKLLNIQSTGLAGLLELQILDLSNNNFSHLSEFSLPPFPDLQKAYLWHNPIETVLPSTFEIMNDTKSLYIGSYFSPLELHSNSFHGLIHLNKLVVLNVKIEILEKDQLTGMPQLNFLKITGNISSISFDAFLAVPLLDILELQFCNIKAISLDAFLGLNKLTVLDLSNNSLDSLPLGVFEHLLSLQELYLQNNNLAELPEGFFTSLPAKMVRLQGNLWDCTCDMKNWLPSITNKVKQVKSVACEDDKKCLHYSITYEYDQKVAPHCHSPKKYKGWSVYHVLRNELHCSKTKDQKSKRKEFIQKKYEQYETRKRANNEESYNKNKYKIKYEMFQSMHKKPQMEVIKKKIQYISQKEKSYFNIPSTNKNSTQPVHYNTNEGNSDTFKYPKRNTNLKKIEQSEDNNSPVLYSENNAIEQEKESTVENSQKFGSIKHNLLHSNQMKRKWKEDQQRKRRQKMNLHIYYSQKIS